MWSNNYTKNLAKPLKRLQRASGTKISPKKQNISFFDASLSHLLQDYKSLEEKIHHLSVQDIMKENLLVNLKSIFHLRKMSNNQHKADFINSIIYKLCKEICILTYQEANVDRVFSLACQEKKIFAKGP